METPKIGIAIITKNEADRIGPLISSVAFADDILVVDSGSTDGTCEICEKLGARVLFNEWPGYSAQKQFALEAVEADWILSLDADEEVSEGLAREIRKRTASAGAEVSAFSMPRLSRYLGRWIKHGGWYPDRKVRLVRCGKGKWSGDALHEHIVTEGTVEHLSQPILHHVYRNIFDQVVTINRFSDIYAGERAPARGGFVIAGVVHSLGKFIECYLWKLGALDGIAGLVIAMNSAWYVFLKHAKAWELGIREKNSTGS